MIALAMMHKVQVGILFDRVFLIQLGGIPISLEDIRGADPVFYNSCNHILKMEAALLDSDILGLTFVSVIEELGSSKEVELCHGGRYIAVASRNRETYIHLFVRHRFAMYMAEQVHHFDEGFADILSEMEVRKQFLWRTGRRILSMRTTGKQMMKFAGFERCWRACLRISGRSFVLLDFHKSLTHKWFQWVALKIAHTQGPGVE